MFLQQYEKDYPNFCLLLEISIVLGPSNAGAERIFSLMNWLTADRRSTLTPEHLSEIITMKNSK
mgnify:CR=1 FL=1